MFTKYTKLYNKSKTLSNATILLLPFVLLEVILLKNKDNDVLSQI